MATPQMIVSAPRRERLADGRWRVSARVGGEELQLVADDEVAANGDAFAVALALPAAKAGATLAIDADVDARLLAGLTAAQAIARRDWRFPGATVAPRGVVERAPQGSEAMFFTGGVDSFYTLSRNRGSLARLIFVDGFDLSLDRARFAMLRANIAEVARETGVAASFPAANLRRARVIARTGWEVTFGAQLAAVAHALAPVVSRVRVASSMMGTGYGSTPELDPLWSSGAVAVVHDGYGATRLDKIAAIGDWPLVHRFLRVCFAHRSPNLNCGTCEKCVRNQAAFAALGARDRLTTFPRRPLAELIDGVPSVPAVNHEVWQQIRDATADAGLRRAMDRMLARRPSAAQRLRDAATPLLDPLLDRAPGAAMVRRLARRLLRPRAARTEAGS